MPSRPCLTCGVLRSYPCRVAEYAEMAADRVRAETPHGCECSAGIAYWNGTESAEALVARADGALYLAKQAGRNQAVTANGA